MKAEHRKELQTNALADRMGRLIQRMKVRPSKNTVLTWFLIIILGLAVLFFVFTSRNRRSTDSRYWAELEGGHYAELVTLSRLSSGNQGKAARFQLAWIDLWENGIKDIPTLKVALALKNIEKAKAEYARLAEECKEDPVLGPEALYQIAVAEETFAVQNPEVYLKKAREAYQKVAQRFPNSAHGKSAAQRAEELVNEEKMLADEGKMGPIYTFYLQLSRQDHIRGGLLFQGRE
jgi:hypothetical protein